DGQAGVRGGLPPGDLERVHVGVDLAVRVNVLQRRFRERTHTTQGRDVARELLRLLALARRRLDQAVTAQARGAFPCPRQVVLADAHRLQSPQDRRLAR